MLPDHAPVYSYLEQHAPQQLMPSNGDALDVKVNFDWTREPPPPSLSPFQRLFRNVDWAKTGFGPMASWPTELRTIVRLLLVDTSPVILYWGQANSIMYNEAYMPFVGEKHPHILGMNASDVFINFGGVFEDILREQRLSGLTSSGASSMLLIERHGFLEETYCDWKMIPVIDDCGDVVGSYGVTTDLTKDVIWTRRNECVTNLAHHTAQAATIDELWEVTVEGLERDDKDVPFALMYSVKEEIGTNEAPNQPSFNCRLERSVGVDPGHPLAPEYLDIQRDLGGFAPTMLQTLHQNTMLPMDANSDQLRDLLQGVEWKGYALPCKQFVVLPVHADGRIVAFLVLGLNPYRRYNAMYKEFLRLITDVLGPQVSRLQLSQEVDRRAELARRAMLNFQKSETRFMLFAERSIIGLAMTDGDGNIRFANDAWYRFTGLSPSDKQHLTLEDGVISEDVELLRKWQGRVIKEKEGTFQIRSKEPFRQGKMFSERRTGICACYSDMNDSGELDSLMVLVMDISELKWTEQQLLTRTRELEASEEKYRNFAEHCPLGIVRTNGEGYVQYGNEAWYMFYDIPYGDPVPDPQPWLKYVHQEDLQRTKDFFLRLTKNSRPESCEIRHKSKKYTMSEGEGGVSIDAWVSMMGFSEFKEDGTLDYIDFWVTDISAHKMAAKVLTNKMEEAIRLKTQQERFIDMVSHEIRNPLSAVLHCGEEIVEAMETSSALLNTMVDQPTLSSPCALSKAALKRQLQASLEASQTIMYCVQHQKQIVDDVLTLSKLDSDLLVVSPAPLQPMVLVRSSLKIFEAELRMADITLNIVEDESINRLGLGWILLDANRYMQIVINLVTNAIKFTKPSKVRQITITVSASTDRPLASLHGVDFVPKRRNPNAPPNSTTAPASVFVNPFDKENDIFLTLSVKDTGKGLTDHEKTLLFKRFAQASPKTHIEYGGSGLGLFISRQITELLGGEIGMASEPNIGSVFAFYVRARKTQPPPNADAAEPLIRIDRTLSLTTGMDPVPQPDDSISSRRSSGPGSVSSGRKILVVEDNLVNQKVLVKQLRNHDFIVRAANHGREALDAILTCHREEGLADFDAVLCDIEMPIMDGLSFAREVRHLETHGELNGHLPIIAVTANVRSTHVSVALESGMDGITTKPYRIQELIDQIDRLCPSLSPSERASV